MSESSRGRAAGQEPERWTVPADQCNALTTHLRREPGATSRQQVPEDHPLVLLRLLTDPGCPEHQLDGWAGVLAEWHCCTYTYPDPRSGDLVTLPTIALLATDGRLARYPGWQAVNAWCALCRSYSPSLMRGRVTVHVQRIPARPGQDAHWAFAIPGKEGKEKP